MSILRSIIISFSLYSRIPMPHFIWDEKDMKHVITFLPLVGTVIGLLSFFLIKTTMAYEIPCMVVTLLLLALPILVTGGFHLDGFMDVQDARNSYQEKEKKLEIMKDPHIGAFAVISVLCLGLIWGSALYYLVYGSIQTGDRSLLYAYCTVPMLIRGLCGVTCIRFSNAKKESMLNMESGKAGKGDAVLLIMEILSALIVMYMVKPIAVLICLVVSLIYVFYYKKICYSNFGGITGDTSGFFIVTGECLSAIALAVLSIWG